MDETMRRLSLLVLSIVGLATLGLAAMTAAGASAGWEMQHRSFLVALTGVGLLAAVVMPSLRLPAVGAAFLSKAAVVVIWLAGPGTGVAPGPAALETLLAVALAAAFAVLLRDALLEARWERMLPLRSEA